MVGTRLYIRVGIFKYFNVLRSRKKFKFKTSITLYAPKVVVVKRFPPYACALVTQNNATNATLARITWKSLVPPVTVGHKYAHANCRSPYMEHTLVRARCSLSLK